MSDFEYSGSRQAVSDVAQIGPGEKGYVPRLLWGISSGTDGVRRGSWLKPLNRAGQSMLNHLENTEWTPIRTRMHPGSSIPQVATLRDVFPDSQMSSSTSSPLLNPWYRVFVVHP